MTTLMRRILLVMLAGATPMLMGQGCLPSARPVNNGNADPGGNTDGDDTDGGGQNPPPGQVSLAVVVEGQGTVDPADGNHPVGTLLSLTATPAAGWRFDHWEGDLSGGPYDHWRDAKAAPANPAALTMNATRSVKAVFKLRQVESATFDLGGGVTLEVVTVPGGTFTMGSSAEEQTAYSAGGVNLTDEGPQHPVTVSDFAMSVTEVTQLQFRTLMGFIPTPPADCGDLCDHNLVQTDDRPTGWTSWTQAVAFCDAMTGLTGRLCRLPTEAEWEYACRASSPEAYSFGGDAALLGDYAWYDANSGWAAVWNAYPVAGKLPNAYGLYDLHGSVWEWVGDWYGLYSAGAQTDPTGPSTTQIIGPRKIMRGGAFSRGARYLRSAYRYDIGQYPQFNFGFRVVCE